MRRVLKLLAFLLIPAFSLAQSVEDLADRVHQAFGAGERFTIAEMIADPEGEAETVSRYYDVERALYWQSRDVAAAAFVAEQAIAYCLARAVTVGGENPSMARQLRSAAGRFAFNLASATWPGWDETGIEITRELRERGLESAKLALRLSMENNPTAASLANGHWMLGAHRLSAGQYREAIDSFGQAASYGREAGDRGTELISVGFVALTEIVADMDPEAAEERLEGVRESLASDVEDPGFWTLQLDAAYRVFVGSGE